MNDYSRRVQETLLWYTKVDVMSKGSIPLTPCIFNTVNEFQCPSPKLVSADWVLGPPGQMFEQEGDRTTRGSNRDVKVYHFCEILD